LRNEKRRERRERRERKGGERRERRQRRRGRERDNYSVIVTSRFALHLIQIKYAYIIIYINLQASKKY
jgi:hypothetical protein